MNKPITNIAKLRNVTPGCCCHYSYHAEQEECGLCHGLCEYAQQTMYDDYVASVLDEEGFDPWAVADDTEF
jgi:hypothetical protein